MSDPHILGMTYGIILDLSYFRQYITADDVQEHLRDKGFLLGDIGNLAGSFFKEATVFGAVKKLQGISVPSRRAGRNRSAIGVYESQNFRGAKQTVRNFIDTYNPVTSKPLS